MIQALDVKHKYDIIQGTGWVGKNDVPQGEALHVLPHI